MSEDSGDVCDRDFDDDDINLDDDDFDFAPPAADQEDPWAWSEQPDPLDYD